MEANDDTALFQNEFDGAVESCYSEGIVEDLGRIIQNIVIECDEEQEGGDEKEDRLDYVSKEIEMIYRGLTTNRMNTNQPVLTSFRVIKRL